VRNSHQSIAVADTALAMALIGAGAAFKSQYSHPHKDKGDASDAFGGPSDFTFPSTAATTYTHLLFFVLLDYARCGAIPS
jgi:hypothetical protein